MADHPYRSLPDRAFWKRTVAAPRATDVDPVGEFSVRIDTQTKVATAGSCFAQHIARYLRNSGFNYYVAEHAHPILPKAIAERHNYGMFSARYGNIYTVRQLLQLFDRAYGRFEAEEDAWVEADDVVLDPYRPTVQPGGFVSIAEMHADRAQHLAAVRHLFETLDVFVFTLGLTECWRSRADGAVFPVCPGVSGGRFDAAKHEFYNQTAADVSGDLDSFIRRLGEVNPRARIILTVSPVPLVATAEPGGNALAATSYSKAVLRVAAEEMRRAHRNVDYFPSYEIITGAHARGAYFAEDLRTVTEAGVAHVMGLFFKHAASAVSAPTSTVASVVETAVPEFIQRGAALVEVECDEIALER